MDPSIIGDIPDMLQVALMCCDQPPKALAMGCQCSVSAIYEATKGTRQIPAKAMKAFSQTNLIAAASMAIQVTGLKYIFGYRKGDRHIQSRIVELQMYDKTADEAMINLPKLLLNKNSKDDLAPEDIIEIKIAVARMIERDNVSFNLFMELDVRYGLNLVELMQNGIKKETILAVTSMASKK